MGQRGKKMSRTIFKNMFRRNWKLTVIFLALLCMYLSVIISLIEPDDMEKVQGLFTALEGFMGVFSIEIEAMTSPLNYTASTFFSVLVMAFTMVFYVIQARALIARQVEDTSIVCTLSAPVKRSTLVLTGGVYLIFSMTVIFLGILGCGSGMLSLYGEFDMAAYANLVGVTFCLCTAVAMLSYFLSAAFCGSTLGSRLSVGIPIAFLFIQMMSGAGGEQTEWMSKITPFGYLDSVGIVTGDVSTGGMYAVFAGAVIVLLLASVFVFNRKRLYV